MRYKHSPSILQLITCSMLLFVLSACGVASPAASDPQVFPMAPTEELGGLSAENAATLKSLEKLDDYPLYVMYYTGSYEYPRIGSAFPVLGDFSCSLFATLGDEKDRLYGRNFDWEFSPALLLFTDPPDGYASVSMVDLTFLGITTEASKTLIDQPFDKLTALLDAPSMPFDGMNEYGLTIGMAAVPDEFLDDASYDRSRPQIGSIGIIRQVLDHARNVDEALGLFGQYNIDFSGGPPIHYLIADRAGKAVLVEFYQGKMVQLPNEAPWHLATNHLRCIAQGDGSCPRYHLLSERLAAQDGQLEPGEAMQLLSEVTQGLTQWSSVYDMSSGDIYIAIGQSYDEIHEFHLDLQSP